MTPARDRDDIEPSAGGKAQRLEALESEVDQLHQAVRSYTIVDQAIGVLVAVGQLSPAEGWDVLREVSMRTNIKLRHVAELLIEWGQSGALCSDIRRELDRQLAQRAGEAGRPSTHTRPREGTSPVPDPERTGTESEFAAEPSQEDRGPSHAPG
ncbi:MULTISPECIES: ANTAR domain-containing protein [unclassified Streptomyces]|uniref:ANTAR domain-containing protein n=1 Tax=unclassified Streptomyces TaxID=2593676 RepID=UPI002B1CF567|nr:MULTISPECIES: ANTAR domain-containing protein [unclassified Streptomyces]